MSQKSVLLRIPLLLIALVFSPGIAGALPTNFLFSSGQVTLRAVLDDGLETSILSGPSPALIQLGGSFVTFDPNASPKGTLLAFQFVPASTIQLDLDESVTTLDSVAITSAMLTEVPGATADLNLFGQFTIASLMSGQVTGVLAGGGPFGPQMLASIDSAATGFLFVSSSQLQLNLSGVNLARFAQVGSGPDVLIKADLQFMGVVPEPGTALLLGVGLAGLAASASIRRV